MSAKFAVTLVHCPGEPWYMGYVPELGNIVAHGNSFDEVLRNIKIRISYCFQGENLAQLCFDTVDVEV